jgi:hypothetical protein
MTGKKLPSIPQRISLAGIRPDAPSVLGRTCLAAGPAGPAGAAILATATPVLVTARPSRT